MSQSKNSFIKFDDSVFSFAFHPVQDIGAVGFGQGKVSLFVWIIFITFIFCFLFVEELHDQEKQEKK